jgi:ABC-type glycerol-3-phosphate transport system substrate-binding protein
MKTKLPFQAATAADLAPSRAPGLFAAGATRRHIGRVALGLAGAPVAVLAAACGGTGSGATSTEALPKPAAQPMELRVTTDTSIQNLPGWQNAAQGYEQKYATRKVTIEHLTSGLIDKVIAQQAAGDPPPIFYTSTPGVHNLGPKGVNLDLMPLVKAYW